MAGYRQFLCALAAVIDRYRLLGPVGRVGVQRTGGLLGRGQIAPLAGLRLFR